MSWAMRRWSRIVLLAGAGALWCAQASAGEPHRYQLPNGMRLVVQSNEHTSTVVLCAMVRVSALHEPRGCRGIRRMVQELIGRGDCCATELAEVGARLEVSVAPDYAELTLAAPAEEMGECAGLMRRLLFAPQFTQEALETERARVIREIAAVDELPTGRALRCFYEQLYPGIGAGDMDAADPAAIAALTLEEIRRFHSKHYLPNATVLTLSGGVDEARAVAALRTAMSTVLPGARVAEAPLPPPAADGEPERLEGSAGTSVYVRGGRAIALGAVDYPAAAVGFTALAAGMDSRLYRALRIERALAYTIVGEFTPSATAPSAFVLVTCNPADLDEVVAVVDREIERIKSEPLSGTELQRAKRYLIGRHALRRQRNQEIAHYLALFELLGGAQGFRRDAQLAGEIAAVDARAVVDAMGEIFDPTWAVRLEGRQSAQG